jgi:CSLREA domain-containing protein
MNVDRERMAVTHNRPRRRGVPQGLSVITGLIFCLVLATAVSTPALAKTFTVDTKKDAVDWNPGNGFCETAVGECSLRAAVQEANALSGTDEIVLNARSYLLTIDGSGEDSAATGDLDITDNLAITGKGAEKTSISGNQMDRVLHILGSSTLDIEGVTIQNGLVNNSGGGIFNDGGKVTIKYSTITNNSARGITAFGGGICNDGGAVKIINSTLSSNMAFGYTSTTGGGGIYNSGGTVTMTYSTVSNNVASGTSAEGGGIFNGGSHPVLKINGSSVVGNTALGSSGLSLGGGIHNRGTAGLMNAKLFIKNTVISSNLASAIDSGASGGAIWNDGGSLKVAGSTISKNRASGNRSTGGGVFMGAGPMKVGRTRILENVASGSKNSGRGGGLLYSSSNPSTIENESVIMQNFASRSGGGIELLNDTLIITGDSVISDNAPSDIEGIELDPLHQENPPTE